MPEKTLSYYALARFAFICVAVESDVGNRFAQEHDSRQLMFCDGYPSQMVYIKSHTLEVLAQTLWPGMLMKTAVGMECDGINGV